MIEYEIRGDKFWSELVENENRGLVTKYYDESGEMIFWADGWKSPEEDKDYLLTWWCYKNHERKEGEGWIKSFRWISAEGERKN